MCSLHIIFKRMNNCSSLRLDLVSCRLDCTPALLDTYPSSHCYSTYIVGARCVVPKLAWVKSPATQAPSDFWYPKSRPLVKGWGVGAALLATTTNPGDQYRMVLSSPNGMPLSLPSVMTISSVHRPNDDDVVVLSFVPPVP